MRKAKVKTGRVDKKRERGRVRVLSSFQQGYKSRLPTRPVTLLPMLGQLTEVIPKYEHAVKEH